MVRENYELGVERAVLAELNADTLFELAAIEPLYQPLPRYPAIVRDLAVVISQDQPVQSIEDVIWQCGGELMESCVLFDVYQGNQVAEGKKSVAYTLTFRHPERTLKDKEVNEIYEEIVKQLKSTLDAVIRS
jgi:phenylalanyl-tRNA synthetase beta chain